MPSPRARRHGGRFSSIVVAALAASYGTFTNAATVTWNVNADGSWTALPSNWSAAPALPGAADDVVINQPNPITVTLASGAESIHSLMDDNTLTFTGGTLAVANILQVNGTFNLNGGTLQNTTLATGAAGIITVSAGALSNVALASDVSLNAVDLSSTNNLTLSGGNLILNSSSYYAILYANVSETIGGTGAMVFNGNYSSGGSISNFAGSPTVTLTSGITLKTGTGGGTTSVTTLINQGTISAQTNGAIIGINDSTFANAGTLQALNGGTLTINAAAWSSNGTIKLDSSSTINLGGTFTTAGLGTIARTGGTINVVGTLDNTGANLLLNTATGSIVLSGGTIKNGVISSANGAQLLISTGTLSNVTLATNVAFDSTALNMSNNLTLSGSTLTLNSTSYYANLFVNSNQTIGGTGTILFNGGYSSGGAISNFAGAPTLTIASGITLKTGTGGGTLGVTSLVNQGTFSAQTNGTIIGINGSNFTNTGILQALNGGTITINSANWSNAGTLSLDSSSTVNLGGAFTTAGLGTISRSGGTINLTGTLDNTGATLVLNAATGSFILSGGTIKNGTISSANGAQLIISTGTLSNVTLATDIAPTAVGLSIANNLTLNSNITLNSTSYYAFLYVNANETINGNGAIIFNGNYSSGGSVYNFIGAPTLTLGPGVTVKTGTGGGTTGVATLLNQGTLSAQTNGALLSINDPIFTNAGTVQAINGGTLNISAAPTNYAGGALTGGTWNVYAFSTLILPVNITTNAANITLDGLGSSIYTSAAQTASPLSTLIANSGSFTISSGRAFTVFSNFTNSGTLVVGATSTFSSPQLILNGGTLAGGGTVSAAVVAGAGPHSIAPGLPSNTAAATLTLTSLSTNANTTLAFDLSIPTASDRLVVSASHGLAFNGGDIQITSLTANAAALGYYKLIQYSGTFSGSLAGLSFTSNTPSVHYFLDTLHDPGFIDLHFSLIGDANDDGHVDLTDLNTVLNHLGTVNSAWSAGNFDGQPTIDLTDLNDILNNLGASYVLGGSVVAPAVPSPEPASLLLLGMALPAVGLRASACRKKG